MVDRWNGSAWPSSIFALGYDDKFLQMWFQLFMKVSSQAGCTPFTQCSIFLSSAIIRFCKAALPIITLFRNKLYLATGVLHNEIKISIYFLF